MNDLVRQSGEITDFRRNANPGMNFSVSTSEGLNSTYDLRETNAKLLVKVIAWDLQRNNGETGEYFAYFTYKMGAFDTNTRKLIKDVIDRVKDSVRHGAGHVTEDKKSAYEKRMGEIEGF